MAIETYVLRYCRTISLLPMVYNIFSKILNNELQTILYVVQLREQAGFSIINYKQIFKELMYRTEEYEIPLAMTFIYFKKTFDSIHPKTIQIKGWQTICRHPGLQIERTYS